MQINLDDMPKDPIERLLWLSGAQEAFDQQINPLWQRAYYDARLTGRLETALTMHLHPVKKILAFTRAENEANGRSVRWGDGRVYY